MFFDTYGKVGVCAGNRMEFIAVTFHHTIIDAGSGKYEYRVHIVTYRDVLVVVHILSNALVLLPTPVTVG